MTEANKILVPVDFSDNSRKVFDSAVFFAGKCGATIDVIYVVQSFDDYSGFFVPHMPMARFEEELVEGAEKKLESFLAESSVAVSRVLLGDVAEEIVQYAEKENIDFIIMGTHGYKGLEKIMFGSVADKVVRAASCPVMTINPYKTKTQS